MAHVLLIGSLAQSLLNFRGDLIKDLLARGHKVTTAAPDGPAEVDETLALWGVRRISIGLDRTGSGLLSDLRLLSQLLRLMRASRPDVVIAYTIKPIVYGLLAARLSGVAARVAMITGLGFAFAAGENPKQRLVRLVARTLYGIAARCTSTFIFQNPDDESEFRRIGLIRAGHGVFQSAGSGVNMVQFVASCVPTGSIRFLMVARLLADKGVREYLAAARAIRLTRNDLSFHLVGPLEKHPLAIPREEVQAAVAENAVVYHGAVGDVRPFLADCHVYVLPSYREGTPRSVLEAMAVGRPIVTTDAPGCRETVTDGDNGFLVPPGQTQPLIDALLRMASLPRPQLLRMANRSRQIAAERFEVHVVNSKICSALTL